MTERKPEASGDWIHVREAKIVHRTGCLFPPGLFLMLEWNRNGGWYSELIRLDEKEKEITPHRPKAG